MNFRSRAARMARRALMHGFLNLLVAAVLCAAGSTDPQRLEPVLEERNPHAFGMERDGIRWRDALVSNEQCAEARAHLLRSVGSCSFEEPIADLRALGWWPEGSPSLTTSNSQLPTPNLTLTLGQPRSRLRPARAAVIPQECGQPPPLGRRDVQDCRDLL